MVAIDPEIVAVIDFDLRAPRRAGDESSAYCRHWVHLIANRSVRLKARLFHEPPGAPNIGIDEKDGLIAVFKMADGIFPRGQFVEGHAREYRQRQRFPFIAGRSSGQTE